MLGDLIDGKRTPEAWRDDCERFGIADGRLAELAEERERERERESSPD